MADEMGRQLPRGVAVSRRHGAPPWGVSAGDPPSLHVVVQGSFFLAQDGARVLGLEPGDVVLLGAGPRGAAPREHSLRCVAPSSGAASAPAELLSATYAAAPDGALAALAPVVHLPGGEVRRAQGLSAVVSLLRAALAEPSAGQERLARSLLEPLLAYTLHCHGRAGDGRAAGAFDRRVARALQLIQEKLAARWTIEALARAAGLSRAAFARRFLAEVGVPPLRYVAELRMQRAAELLAEGDRSLASVAAEVGYDSEFAFSRAFKRHTGEAPGAFRRRSRSQGAPFRLPPVRAAA
ncbi:AraC family transcriptional regulator [Sorangium cellulosum]|uniref:AraC family transcriptional regulator n=1 Tax=Sorangium cellulosum TaxID=56 RepID=A0A150QTQ8_SORCE|nr:AraC family transcriptional regulator [Sorangium cellulosum]KYF70948.1 AraC family transcriptional regulator [Sorangium cellulosum]